ncbi:hypothetical protein OCS_01193 [Ophiocordyceps sinensis CO18]|nr:hypothetical protein OCS_01193 [Ophiocordyceps sinensis CO18]
MAQKEEFWAVVEIWHGRAIRRMNYCMPVGKFIDLVQQTRFNDVESASELNFQMEMTRTPLIELGTSDYGGRTLSYGIRTGGHYLWPNVDNNPNEPGLLDRHVLGINLNVTVEYRRPQLLRAPLSARHRRREQPSSGEDSVESAESDDVHHEHGFAFAQIGALYFSGDDFDDDSDSPIDWSDPDCEMMPGATAWVATGFGAVVEVKPDGRTGAVWVVYNFYEAHEENAHQKGEHIPVLDDDDALLPNIGRLYTNCTQQFTVAKIANSLEDLRRPRSGFTFDVAARDERQIVRAKLGGTPRLVQRQYIKRPPRPAC